MSETSDVLAEENDYDSPWKEALELYFPQFMDLLFPFAAIEINWAIPHEFLQNELQQIVRDAESGRNYIDKLVKVFTLTGEETWFLIHIEIQGIADAHFNQRMYRYHYRLSDYHPDQSIASFAVITNQQHTQHLGCFQKIFLKTQIQFTFPVLNLRDWQDKFAELETNPNPFAIVILAQLWAHQTSKNPLARKDSKFKLIRLLYERGYAKQDILELFRFIDWMLSLPEQLEKQLTQEINLMKEEQKMKYVTSWERFGEERGIQIGEERGIQIGETRGIQIGETRGIRIGETRGIQIGETRGIQIGETRGEIRGEAKTLLKLLQLKFGAISEAIEQQVASADKAQLDAWIEKILTAESLASLFSNTEFSK